MNATEQYIAFKTLATKEILRFARIWIQTLLPPMVISALYLIIFGRVLGAMIPGMGGVTYIEFIVPGIILMTVIQNAYANVVSSSYSSKFQRNFEEILVSPTPSYVILLGFTAGGLTRGLCVGLVVVIVSMAFTQLRIHNVFILLSVITLTSVLFSLAGFINGIYAKSFDDISIVPTFILTPLSYLGGVFFQLAMLPDIWQRIAKFNPIFYMVDAFRYGFTGTTPEVSLLHSYLIMLLFVVALYSFALHLLRRGKGLRT